MKFKLSIAMTTYNGEKYIQQQLESIINQTLLPSELVITDDVSTDNTIKIIERFLINAPFPVRVIINEKNLGYTENFLRCAQICKYEWIAFCDQDDYWLPNKIEKIAEHIINFRGNDLLLIGHTAIVADKDLIHSQLCIPYYKKNKYLKPNSNYAFNCTVGFASVVHTSLINDFNHKLRPQFSIDGSHLGHDQWLSMLANALGTVGCIAEPLAVWRRHSLSATGTPIKENLQSQIFNSLRINHSEEYILNSKMVFEAAKSLANISKDSKIINDKRKLIEISKDFFDLASNLKIRGKIYNSQSRMDALVCLLNLILNNAYFYKPIKRLGWKSFLKDTFFILLFFNKHEN
jgi:glycosyltransferase involved in cell wall biosynthesis